MQQSNKVLTKNKHGIVSGTLSGLAEHFGISKGRLRFVFFILGFMGIGFIFYFVLWISIPNYSQRAELQERQ
ncbi:PspC domain-containing protein [Cognaticolwellia mytili]|uniref:PspC domain-containing protein n=1 Tax=Cognaticolwellia mytili TaxID=1888913 RepID=UPI000A1762D9|nr:PspC domain-containing protein [Cognaticolwellia mytili]